MEEISINTQTLKNAYHTVFVRLHESLDHIETFFQQYHDSTDSVYSNSLRYYRDLLQYTLCALPFE
ncbi:hypothetical protein KA405_05300 [Patescibacteria group bacterium]|nr:hypothetical protein [Patescibacteria group bacterium]